MIQKVCPGEKEDIKKDGEPLMSAREDTTSQALIKQNGPRREEEKHKLARW
jgi:hypothetical protein